MKHIEDSMLQVKPGGATSSDAKVDETMEESMQNITDSITGELGDNTEVGQKSKDWKEDMVENSMWFNLPINVVTLLNTVQMGFEADHPDWSAAWTITENFFTACFFLEMTVKLIILKRKYFHDKANWLDGSLTVLGAIDCWILAPFGGDGADLQSLSVLRILRLVRLARVMKLVRSFKPMVLVIQGVAATISTTIYVFGLMVIIFYVFAIFLTEHLGKAGADLYPGFAKLPQQIDEQDVIMDYNPHVCFGSMLSSMLTLFNMAILAEWSEIVRPVAIKQPAYIAVFVFFAIFVGFGVLNVMIGLILDSVIAESKRIDESYHDSVKKEKMSTLERIQDLLIDLDTNQDNMIEIEELQSAVHTHPWLQKHLKAIDLPQGYAPRELLNMLDDNGDGVLEKAEFVTSFFRLINSDDFQKLCILQTGINQVKHMIFTSDQAIRGKLSHMEAEVQSIKTIVCQETGSQARFAKDASQRKDAPSKRQFTNDKPSQQLRLDSVCNELKESIEDISHKQLMDSLEIAYTAMKEVFQKELALAKPDLETSLGSSLQDLGVRESEVMNKQSPSSADGADDGSRLVGCLGWSTGNAGGKGSDAQALTSRVLTGENCLSGPPDDKKLDTAHNEGCPNSSPVVEPTKLSSQSQSMVSL